MLHLLVDIESTKIQYRPVNAMLLMKGGGYWEYWNPIPPCKCNVADEYSSSYGIIYGHLLLLENDLLGNNEDYENSFLIGRAINKVFPSISYYFYIPKIFDYLKFHCPTEEK